MKVLLIGNSQMQCYNLPLMMKTMSESAPPAHPCLDIGRFTVGGGTLKKYWDTGEAPGSPRAMIAGDKWDYVVIQEIFCGEKSEFEEYAEMFDKLIRKSGAKTILFATANVTQYYDASFKYPDSFEKLNDMQIAFGKKSGIPVAAAGYAWMKYLGPNPSESQVLDLYHADKGHPGPKGTYIYACILYACITGLNPTGLTSEFKDIPGFSSLTKEETIKMQKCAWEQYLNSRKKNKK